MTAASYRPWCTVCGTVDSAVHVCPSGGVIRFYYDGWQIEADERSLWRYRARLPISASTLPVSLGEGMTPLLRVAPERLGMPGPVWLKDETRNPTGSMKDRAMTLAYTHARETGAARTIIASAGGSGIAASAYAARAGIEHWVLVPADVPKARLVLSALYGSHIMRLHGSFEDVDRVVRQAESAGFMNVSTYREANPFQAEGPKTIAYEIVEQLGKAPDMVIVPVGGGGTLAGIWEGFKDAAGLGLIDTLPKMVSVQNVLFNALEQALEVGATTSEELQRIASLIDEGRTTVTPSVRHAYPPDGMLALVALSESHGYAVSATDAEALAGQALLAKAVGVFAEPSSALAVSALAKVRPALAVDTSVVVVVTGLGLRDLGSPLLDRQVTLSAPIAVDQALGTIASVPR